MSPRIVAAASLLLGASLLAVEPLDTTIIPPASGLAADSPRNPLTGVIAHRDSANTREAARLRVGFPVDTQAAIDKTLHYLDTQQQADGSWGDHQKIGSTSFALLAYLGNGVTPLSDPHGEHLINGITFLIDEAVANKGKLGTRLKDRYERTWPLEHALATQALAEVIITTQQINVHIPKLEAVVQVAAQWLIDNQATRGGWDFWFREESPVGGNTWLTVPSIHALLLVQRAGVETRNQATCLRKASDFLQRLQSRSGAVRHIAAMIENDSMTGGSAFVFQLAGRGSHSLPRNGCRYLVSKRPPFAYKRDTRFSDLLALHYDALAIRAYRGKAWDNWHPPRTAEVLKNQQADGSFAPQNDQQTNYPVDVAIHRSSLACLFLETPWRYSLK